MIFLKFTYTVWYTDHFQTHRQTIILLLSDFNFSIQLHFVVANKEKKEKKKKVFCFCFLLFKTNNETAFSLMLYSCH